jgi:hypothetical protein
MGYMHIDNLYKAQEILLFREAYALEKIHGTSTYLSWKDQALHFSSGGVSHQSFVALFKQEELVELLKTKDYPEMVVFGEGYGGKCQGMSATYGKQLRFVAFEVKIGEFWLSVPQAEEIVQSWGLEFVPYAKVSTDLASLDAERDAPSVQAIRNGISEPKIREGIVLRPLIEVQKNNGERIIAKHKRSEFSERATIPEVDPTKRQILEQAEAIALEWVTPMRLQHVLDKLNNPRELSAIPEVIKAMIEDVVRESTGEIMDSKDARKAIGARACKLYKDLVYQGLLDVSPE